jgi:membrane fusion protein (multidrug efflux system)
MQICPGPRLVLAASSSFVLFLAGCQSEPRTASAAAAPPAFSVSVVEVKAQDVPIYSEYAAQTYARDMVEVRGRVNGYVEKRAFQIGSDVKAGQVLYVLDLRPYQAEVERAKGQVAQAQANLEFAKKQVSLVQAEADLAQARANLLKARQDVDRLAPLVKQDAAAQQDLDNANAALQANQANVDAKKANVEQMRLSTRAQIETAQAQLETNQAELRTAELNLEYATIRAPIGGRIGDSVIQVGGLVTSNSLQPLTTIVPLDPIWVRFKVSESEYLAMKRRTRLPIGEGKGSEAPLQLVLADGSVFPYSGRVQNAVNQVDPKTGTLELQATFPNPQHTLLPGQFGRVRMTSAEQRNAILVPQRAIQDLQGLQSVYIVGPGNKVLARTVTTGERVGDQWIVLGGLKSGDRVIVEGLQKVRPGAIVNPLPYRPDPPAGKGITGEGGGS